MGLGKEPAKSLEEAWAHHRREVRRLHEKLFYRPLLEAVARVPAGGVRLTAEAAGQRLAALGYAGTERGAYFPDDPAELAPELEGRGLALVGGWCGLALLGDDTEAGDLAQAEAVARYLARVRAR